MQLERCCVYYLHNRQAGKKKTNADPLCTSDHLALSKGRRVTRMKLKATIKATLKAAEGKSLPLKKLRKHVQKEVAADVDKAVFKSAFKTALSELKDAVVVSDGVATFIRKRARGAEPELEAAAAPASKKPKKSKSSAKVAAADEDGDDEKPAVATAKAKDDEEASAKQSSSSGAPEAASSSGAAASAAAASASAAASAVTEPPGPTTIVLFYTYCVTLMSKQRQTAAIAFAMESLKANGITGRLRIAREGYNGTLTGPTAGVRAFTKSLETFDFATFGHGRVDFKYVDGLPLSQMLKGIKCWPVAEIVTYGFDTRNAPLSAGGTHLKPADFHKARSWGGWMVEWLRIRYPYMSILCVLAAPFS